MIDSCNSCNETYVCIDLDFALLKFSLMFARHVGLRVAEVFCRWRGGCHISLGGADRHRCVSDRLEDVPP